MAKRKTVLGAIALFVLMVACAQEAPRVLEQASSGEDAAGVEEASRSGGVSLSSGAGMQRAEEAPALAEGTVVEATDEARGSIPELPLPRIGAKVIKTAHLEVRVGKGDFQESFSKASLIAERLGGYVTSSSVHQTKGKVASGTITLRIPSDRFQTALADLRSLGKVTGEEQGGEDVTQEFVDLEARLRHARSQEAFYLQLMNKAKTVSELVQTQQQLSQIQLQIEELTGRLEFLKNQTSFATVGVRLFEPGVGPPEPKTRLGRAWQEAADGFRSVVAGLIVGLGWVAPFVLIALALLGAVRVLRRGEARPVGAGEEDRTPV